MKHLVLRFFLNCLSGWPRQDQIQKGKRKVKTAWCVEE